MQSKILTAVCLVGFLTSTSHAAPARYDQVRQGYGPTAWLLASVAAVQASGIDLSKRIYSGGGNQWDVALYNFNNSNERTTAGMRQESYRIEFDGTTLLNPDPAIKPGDPNAAWVVKIQRGLIGALNLWDSTQTVQSPHNGDPADALAMLTGHYPVRIDAKAANARRKVEAALKAKKAVVYVTRGDGTAHADILLYPQPYAVVGASGDAVNIYNPMCPPQCVPNLGGKKSLPWGMAIEEGDCFLIAETHFTKEEQVRFKFNQLRQGSWGNCWMEASMAAIQYSGIDLRNRIKATGKNQYEISLYNYNDPPHRPTGGMNPHVYSVKYDGTRNDADPSVWLVDHRNSDWAVLVYRGFVKAVHQWDPTELIKAPHGGNPADALGILTGKWPVEVDVKAADVRQQVEAALAAHKPVVYDTNPNAKVLMAAHAHALLKSSANEVTLYNPGGFVQHVSWDVAIADGDSFFILDPNPPKSTARADRNYWHYDGGHVESSQPNQWEEQTAGKTYHFVEKGRTGAYVELFDKDRNVTVQLFDDHMAVQKGNGPFQVSKKGGWGK